jgi:hypothetical protein
MATKFNLGEIVVTQKANKMLDLQSVVKAFGRYVCGDWGDVSEHDRKANDEALEGGGRIWAIYRDVDIQKFWIITEHDRNRTKILLPEDF